MTDKTENTAVKILDVPVNFAIVFSGAKGKDGKTAMDGLLSEIEAVARAHTPDMTTKKGQDEIRSLAAKIAKAKVRIDTEGKSLNDERRAVINAVNEDRNIAKDRLQALQDEIRQPLTDFENKEKDRISAHDEALDELRGICKYTDGDAHDSYDIRRYCEIRVSF